MLLYCGPFGGQTSLERMGCSKGKKHVSDERFESAFLFLIVELSRDSRLTSVMDHQLVVSSS